MSVPPLPSENLSWDELPGLFPEFERADRWLPLLKRHAELVEARRAVVRVTAVPPDEAIRRQYAESLELVRAVHSIGWEGPVCDVGSGGGYPGIMIAAVKPETTVHLVEPLQKRARLLAWLVAELELENVQVHAERAEDAGRGALRDSCGLVTARAVAGLAEVLEYTAPFARSAGLVALPKGSGLDEELGHAEKAMSELGVAVEARVAMRPRVSAYIDVLVMRKLRATDVRYPRPAGRAGKRPL